MATSRFRQAILKLTGDPTDAEHAVDVVEGKLKRLDGMDAKARATIKAEAANAQLDRINKRLEAFGKQEQTAEVKIKTARALGQLERVEQKLKDIRRENDRGMSLGAGLAQLRRVEGQGNLLQRTRNFAGGAAAITGLGIGAQGASVAGAGALAVGAGAAPAAGALAAYPALASAAAQGLGVFKLATTDVFKAVGGLNQRLDKNSAAFKKLTPEAKRFAVELDKLKKPFGDLQTTAQRQLLPGLTTGLRSATKNLGVFEHIVGTTARALGRDFSHLGHIIGTEAFGKDLATQGERNTKWIARAGTVAGHLANAFRNITLAAGPLTDWFTKLALHGSRWIDAQAKAGRESGRLQHFFRETRSVLQTLGKTAFYVGDAFFNIAKQGAPLGRDILRSVRDNAKAFDDWTKSVRGKNSIAQFFKDARPGIFELGRLIRDASKDFAKLGSGSQVAPLLQQIRTEMLPAITNLISNTTAAFGPHLITALSNLVKLFSDLAGTSGPLTLYVDVVGKLAGFLDKLLRNNPALNTMVVGFVGLAGALKALRFASAITGAGKLLGVFKRIAQTKAGFAAADAITKGLDTGIVNIRNVGRKIRDVLKRILGRGGTQAGARAAENVAASLVGDAAGSAGLPGTLKSKEGRLRGIFRRAGRVSGKALGAGIAIGLVLAIPELLPAAYKFGKKLGREARRAFIDAFLDHGVRDAAQRLRDDFQRQQSRQPGTHFTGPHDAGGLIYGSGGRDSLLSPVSPGEFIVRRQAVQAIGLSNMRALNATGGSGVTFHQNFHQAVASSDYSASRWEHRTADAMRRRGVAFAR